MTYLTRWKTYIALVVMLCLATAGIASAETYSVRVTHNTNLRASYSLESAVIETVPAGTTVQVIGQFDRWLKIHRNATDVWMADWIPYTRVEGSATPSDVDNCCFIDRQCQSDSEWTAGYWAFQNNQCVAPVQTQTQTSTPAISTDAAAIDNCCYVNRQCNTDQEWQNGYWAYQNNVCGAPQQSAASGTVSSSLPPIDGPPDFVVKVVAAFDYLRSKAPNWFNYVVAKTASVGPHPFFGSRAYMARKRIQIGDTHDDNTTVLASVLVHEACHLYQWDAGRWNSILVDPTRLEVECMEVQLGAMLEFAPRHWFIRRLREAIRNPLVSVGF